MDATVHNNKWLPLIWMEWEFPRNTAISLEDSKESTYLIRFLWLLWFQRVQWTVHGRADQRGVYNMGQVALRSGDGFRFAEVVQHHNLDTLLYVYPKLVTVHVPALRPSQQWGAREKQGGWMEDPLLISGVREYQAGDELRRFNWRASARTGKLHTNVYQPIVTEQIMIYVDVQGYVINESLIFDPLELKAYVSRKKEQFESFLSIIASVAVKYRDQGLDIGYASNALTPAGENMTAHLPCANITPLLDQLARSAARVAMQKNIVLDDLLHKGRLTMPVFVFCERITQNHYQWYEQHKPKLAEIRFFYTEQTPYANKLATRAMPLATFLSTAGSTVKGSLLWNS